MRILIKEPCNADWDSMTPESSGRFCAQCAKTVVDFSAMSDDEVKRYLLDRSGQNICGRMRTSQLNRPLADTPISLNAHWYNTLPIPKQVFYAVMLFFVVGVSACEPEHHSGNPTIPAVERPVQSTQTLGEVRVAPEDTATSDSSRKSKKKICKPKPVETQEGEIMGDIQVQGGISFDEPPRIEQAHADTVLPSPYEALDSLRPTHTRE